nr:MAG TPA: hypothetical protein [Caudoviricetes sp.]
MQYQKEKGNSNTQRCVLFLWQRVPETRNLKL